MLTRVSMAELSSAGIRLRPAEAVAIVREFCRQHAAGSLPFIPSASAVRLVADGTVAVEGPVRASTDDVGRAAILLNALLPPFDAPPEYRASGALRLVVARALGTLDLPRFESVDQLCDALARFSALDLRKTVLRLCHAYATAIAAVPAPALEAVRQVESRPVASPVDATPVAPASELPRVKRPDLAAVPPRSRRHRTTSWSVATQLSAAALLVVGSFVAGWHLIALPTEPNTTVAPVATVATAPPAVSPAPAASPAAPDDAPDVTDPTPREIQPLAFSPAFARSGQALYFHEQRGGASALKVAFTDGRGAITRVSDVVDDRARNFHVKPSPDGSRIAFDSDREGTRAVYIAAADGSGARRISGEGYAAVPSWSPDGRRIAFLRAEPDAPSVWNLWMTDANGSQPKRLTRHSVGQAWGASWFPDGQRIAYSVETRLVILDIQSGQRQTFDSPAAGRLVRTPAVSPDGRRIIFQVHRRGAWLLDIASGSMNRVLDDPTAEEYSWAPDGRRVAFHSRRNGSWGVWLMAL